MRLIASGRERDVLPNWLRTAVPLYLSVVSSPDREFDAYLAESVLGWRTIICDELGWYGIPPGAVHFSMIPYFTIVPAAARVLRDALGARGFECELSAVDDSPSSQWRVEFRRGNRIYQASGETQELAICCGAQMVAEAQGEGPWRDDIRRFFGSVPIK